MHKVLIVDDEKPVRIAISKLGAWSRWHIEPPVYAQNGKEALSTMLEIHPSIVFVDMQMPVMDGTEFLKNANELAGKREFPFKIIVISGYDDFRYAQDAIRYGAIDYLLKPVEPDKLNAAIERAMKTLYPEEDFDAEDDDVSAELSASEVVELIHETIELHYPDNIRIQDFSEKYFFSKEYLSRLFKVRYGIGIYEYLTSVRMKRAEELLCDPGISIADISGRTGFADSNYFSKAFRTYSGMTPSDYRKQHT